MTSSHFLIAPPDDSGIIPDDEFRETFAIYLGLPSPCSAPFVSQWIGTEGHKHKVDKHGNVVSADNAVTGTGHSIVHNYTQALIVYILKTSVMQIQAEAENLFHEWPIKMPPSLTYSSTIIQLERRLDGNDISQSTASAIVEIKGIYVGKN
eukprot:15325530-Ditylum_brightwellii.AAC.1